MLWIARLETTTSKLSPSKGSAVMSSVCNSTRSATPLGDRVAPGGLGGIAGLIASSPQVHAHRPARGQAPSRHEQDRAPAASQVEDPLVIPEVQPVEQFVPDRELAAKPRVEDEGRDGHHEQGGQERPHSAGDDGGHQDGDGQDGDGSDRIGRDKPVRATSPRGHTLGHKGGSWPRVFRHDDEAADRPIIPEHSGPHNRSLPSAARDDPFGDLDAYAAEALRDWKTPAMALSVVKDGRVIFVRGYGVRKLCGGAAVDADSVFPIASITKAGARDPGR
jgi:hypothetical protein